MSSIALSLVREACSRSQTVEILFATANADLNFQTRFLGAGIDTFFIAMTASLSDNIARLIKEKLPVKLSFKDSACSATIDAVFVGRRADYVGDSCPSPLPAAEMALPDELDSIQRRMSYRVHITARHDCTVRVWRVDPGISLKLRPMPSAQLTVQIVDLSITGCKVLLYPRNGRLPQVGPTDRLRVEIEHAGEVVLLEARAVRILSESNNGYVQTGLKFPQSSGNPDQMRELIHLNHLLSMLQREEARVYRNALEGDPNSQAA